MQGDPRMRGDAGFDRVGKLLAIDGKCAAGRNCGFARAGDNDRIEPGQLFFQKPDGIFKRGAAQRVAADELGQARGLMRRSAAQRTHLEKVDLNPGAGSLPCRFAAGKPAPDDGEARRHLNLGEFAVFARLIAAGRFGQ